MKKWCGIERRTTGEIVLRIAERPLAPSLNSIKVKLSARCKLCWVQGELQDMKLSIKRGTALKKKKKKSRTETLRCPLYLSRWLIRSIKKDYRVEETLITKTLWCLYRGKRDTSPSTALLYVNTDLLSAFKEAPLSLHLKVGTLSQKATTNLMCFVTFYTTSGSLVLSDRTMFFWGGNLKRLYAFWTNCTFWMIHFVDSISQCVVCQKMQVWGGTRLEMFQVWKTVIWGKVCFAIF